MNLQRHSFSLFFGGLCLLGISLPLSKSGMSIAQILMGIGWLLAGNFREKIKYLLVQKGGLWIFSFFLLALLGLTYSTNIGHGLDELRIKAPFLVLPLMVVTMRPLSEHQKAIIFSLFLASILIATIIGLFVFAGYGKREIRDIRDVSMFVSHIRFALMICVAIFLLGYGRFFLPGYFLKWKTGIKVGFITWLFIFLIFMESVTGVVILGTTGLIAFLLAKSISGIAKWVVLIFFIIITLGIGWVFIKEFSHLKKQETIQTTAIDSISKGGCQYDHRPRQNEFENGHPVWMFICRDEMMRTWKLRSNIPFTGEDLKGQLVEYTLMRFLTSKGFRKDSIGVMSLQDSEIKSIEKGIANVDFQGSTNFIARIRAIFWELKFYSDGGNPSGHSLPQRMEYWKASLEIIRENPILGTGTGDIRDAFLDWYEKSGSPLSPERRFESHNQFLLITSTFGFVGLLVFLGFLAFPGYYQKKFQDPVYFSFFLISFFSLLTEDTFETQAGVTFFAFFSVLLLFPKINGQQHSEGS